MSTRDLLSIGRFARACRLSIKALRHYDELGLLRPAQVDASGYRYYARSQARTAIAISLLRTLDVPLPAVLEILTSGEPGMVAARLAGERARIEREMARSRQALFCVERIMRDGTLMPYDVAVRAEPAHTMLAVEAETAPELHVEAGYALFERLRRALDALGLAVEQPVTCLLPEPPDGDTMILQMCVDVPAALSVEEARRVDPDAMIVRLAAGPFAFVTHRGPYEELGIAQHAIAAWVQERGREPSGAMREIYVDDPAVVAPPDLRTTVGIPIAP